MYTTDYMDTQFIEEFKIYAEKSHLKDESLMALSYPNATILPFKNGRGGDWMNMGNILKIQH